MSEREDHDRLIRIDEKIDNILEKLIVVNSRLDNHHERINLLETWRNFISGAGAMITTTFSAILGRHLMNGGK